MAIKKRFAAGILILAVSFAPLRAQELRLLVGTYTEGTPAEGVCLYAFDPGTAATRLLSCAPSGNPSFVIPSPDGTKAWSVNEFHDGRQGVSAFRIAGDTISLRQTLPIPKDRADGEDPCNLLFTGDALVTSNYSGGTVTAFALDPDGGIDGLTQTIRCTMAASGAGKRSGRQDAAHMHCAVLSPEGKYVFVTDLGSDCIHRFDRRDGVVPLGDPQVAWQHDGRTAFGPRHMIFSDDGRFAYLLCELGDKLVVFRYADGRLTPIQTLTAYRGGGHGSADIHLSPDGRFLYTSHRLKQDGIAIFSVNPRSGRVKPAGFRETGRHPRNFALSPDGRFLLCACRDDNCIEIYAIDADTGALTLTDQRIGIGAPVCVQFLPQGTVPTLR